MKKIDIWKIACAERELGCFPQLTSYLFNGAFDRTAIMKTMDTHLDKLKDEFHSYFPNIEEMSTSLNWIRNPFMVQSASIPVRLQESLVDVSTDEDLKMKFSATTLTQFCCDVGREYPDLAKHARNCCPSAHPTYVRSPSLPWPTLKQAKKQTGPGEKPDYSCCHNLPQTDKTDE
ncbi:hypothetical protein LDENG_00260860 [Lucifuga dentata]|nr:hypothetical protein LDENG_00260860 [Lucifuga dentata]